MRHLVQDQASQAEIAGKLFAACDRGEIVLVVISAVLAECVFVLESFYKHKRPAIADTLSTFLKSPGIEVDGLAEHLDALERYGTNHLLFVDCLIASKAAASGVTVASFGKDFRKFPDVRVQIS